MHGMGAEGRDGQVAVAARAGDERNPAGLPYGRRLEGECPECGADMILRPSRFGPFYGCERYPGCGATHGAHKANGEPLGKPANKETKLARMAAPAAFDPVWKEHGAPRGAAYGWLAGRLGIPTERCHVGEFDKETCGRVSAIMAETTPAEAAAEIAARRLPK